MLVSEKSGLVDPSRNAVFSARERHSSARVDNLGYPIRMLRTHEYLYVRNFAPDRWPAGDPRGVEGDAFGYYDIDGSPTKTLLAEVKDAAPAAVPGSGRGQAARRGAVRRQGGSRESRQSGQRSAAR